MFNPRRIRLSDRGIGQSLRRLPVRPPPTTEARDLAEAVGRVIYRERLRVDLSQQQLADRLGVNRSAVSRWEHGLRCPTLAHLALLGELGGRSASLLLIEAEDLMHPPRGYDRFEDGFGPDGPDWLQGPNESDRLDRPSWLDDGNRAEREDDDAADD